ncbi:hypothetical protein F4804DRAFT_102592 [Jackrogersella minutella]|nr:hypothetical protein F4804DRAFT_102592 [Jackrogersella minutella]
MAPTGGQHSSTTGLNQTGNGNSNGTGTGTGTGTGNNSNGKESTWQVAASNSTLNTWVGRRQPSWLTNAKPAKPTPRPPQPPAEQPITTEPTRPIQPIVTSTTQPASVTVPVPTTTTTSTTSTTTTTTTSNAPTTTNTSTISTAPAPAPATAASTRQPQPALSPRRTSIQTRTQASAIVTSTSTSAVLPSPAPSDEPSPGIVESLISPPTTKAQFALDTTLDDSRRDEAQVRVSTVRARTSSRQCKDTSLSPSISTRTNLALNTPPTPNLLPTTAQMAPQPTPQTASSTGSQTGPPQEPPAKRRCVPDHTWGHLLMIGGATENLRRRIQNFGGEQGLDIQVERPRYQLLEEACNEGDVFFIALHQLFCAWSINQSSVHQLCHESIHNSSLIDNAFGTIGTLLKSNSKLRPDHVQWFASFPGRLPPGTEAYNRIILKVLNFLTRLAHRWMVAHRDHQSKGYPVLMSELLNDFQLFSPIFQLIMFRASRRSLGIADGPVAVQMETLFKKDQANHRNANGTFAPRTLTVEYQRYNQALMAEYKNIQARRQPSQGTQGGQQSNCPALASVPQQPGLAYPPQMNHMNPQVQPSPDQAHGFQPNFVPLRSNSNSRGVPGNQILYSQSTTPTPLSAHNPPNPVIYNNPSSRAPVLDQFTVRAEHNTFNTFMNTLPSSSTPNYQQMQMQLGKQGAPAASSSTQPRNIPNGQFQFILSNGQWQQGYQDFSTQPVMPPHQVPSPMGQMVNINALPTTYNAAAVQPSPLYPTHRPQGPILPQQAPNPHSRRKPTSNGGDRLIPPLNMRIGIQDYPHSPYDRSSIEGSLHQAHLRSPVRTPRQLDTRKSERYYQAVKFFALAPKPLVPHAYLYKLSFSVPDSSHAKITRDEIQPGGFFPVNRFTNGSLRVRVRCVNRNKSQTPPNDKEWVTADTTWPEHIFMELNGRTLATRRKAHHSKDLPVDISSFVGSGNNILNVHMPAATPVHQEKQFFIAVEMVEVLSHSTVLYMVKEQGSLPAKATRDIIKSRLRRSVDDDDELAMVDYLSIDVTDPFSRSIFKIPVRGKDCTHLECFDLETWLNTRPSKNSCHCNRSLKCENCPNEPSLVDKWKCPLCDGDARPYSLRIDEFLVEVRSKLERNGQLGTKSIFVSSDGTWNPKQEPGDDDNGSDSDDDEAATVGRNPRSTSSMTIQREKAPIEVIEIDDD